MHQLPGLTLEKFLLWFFNLQLTTGVKADHATPGYEITPDNFQIVVNDWECYRIEIENVLKMYRPGAHGDFLPYAEEAYSFLNMALIGETQLYLNVVIKEIKKEEVDCVC